LIEIQDLAYLEKVLGEPLVDDDTELFGQTVLIFGGMGTGSTELGQQSFDLF
jgi:hypothetical protein